MAGLYRRLFGTHVFLLLMGIYMAMPLLFMISTAFKPLDEMFLFPPRFFVIHPTLSNFGDLLTAVAGTIVPPTRYLFNSVVVTVVTVGLIMVIQSMAAYPLARNRFPGRGLIMVLTMAAFMFAAQVTTIPRFLVVSALKLTDTYASLIIPTLAQPFMVFLLTNYMAEVPESLLEAARMDGAGGWFIYRRVMMPLVKPALFTVLILTFISVWYDSFTPMIYLRREVLKTRPLMLGTIGGGAGTGARTGAVAASTLVTALPAIVIFVLVQRNVLQTMAFSGIKE
jgi:ABC-type glycerol-3-phosphate transport system permease component